MAGIIDYLVRMFIEKSAQEEYKRYLEKTDDILDEESWEEWVNGRDL
jgi:hypothetical protein